MRTAEQILGKWKVMTAKDLIKILKKVPENAQIVVPSHCSAGCYSVGSSQVLFDDEKVQIGT